ncbi:MAG: 50S ribosomal protein L21 [Gammaproteobacteria bacterium]|mgnify:FL=1|jgi:large subunit ribosomal protein L21|nr:50S ribosomal protein L21 [Pelagibacterales bacterium]MBT7543693.1 50S ribosomal protein L21 [Gammaproteobacteria bacterium]
MNYAVLKSGGKQYKVSAGDVILVEKILGESGSKITFDDIVMMGEGSQIHIEEAELKSASVTGEVIEQTRGPKLIIFKKKRRQNYRRKKGHKQDLTVIRIKSIDLKKAAVAKTVEAKKVETKTAVKKDSAKTTKAKKVETKTAVKKDSAKTTKAKKVETKTTEKKIAKKAPKKE